MHALKAFLFLAQDLISKCTWFDIITRMLQTT